MTHPSDLLFDSKLIPSSVVSTLPEGYTLRPIARDDYKRGVLETLGALTTVGEISPEIFGQLFDYWHKHNDAYFTIVILDGQGQVVSVGTILVERKLIHACGLVGHIEDIAVAKSQQGKKLGIKLITALTEIGKERGVYKIILDCSEHNVEFYKKCGYSVAGVEMSIRFDKWLAKKALL